MDMKSLTIGRLAKQAGVNLETVRFYERRGVLLSKFAWDSRPIVYGAIGLLVLASLWNTWPRRDTSNDAAVCSNCRKEEIQ